MPNDADRREADGEAEPRATAPADTTAPQPAGAAVPSPPTLDRVIAGAPRYSPAPDGAARGAQAPPANGSTPDQTPAAGSPKKAPGPSRRRGDDAVRHVVFSNLLGQTIEIKATGERPPLRIPPFGRREVPADDVPHYAFADWLSRGLVECEPSNGPDVELFPLLLGIPAVVFLYAAMVFGVWQAIAWLVPSVTVPASYWLSTAAIAAIGATIGAGYWLSRTGAHRNLLRSIGHSVGGLLQLAIAFGVPAAVVFLDPLYWPNGQLSIGAPELLGGELVGPALQVLTIGILAGLPALLFYLFDRQKLTSLREEFYRSIVVLMPSIRTLRDAESVFALRANKVLGESRAGRASRFIYHNRMIIFVTTIMVTVGWVLALANLPAAPGAAGERPLVDYFVPTPDALVYAFLGAYVFGIGMLWRRYAKSDIKPSAYAQFTVRIISAVVIAWTATLVLPAAADHPAVLVTAFVVGFFPDTGLLAIFEFVKNNDFVKASIPSLREKYPLERLDGINIYHRARLTDEGIENMENLAHADLVDLMLETRIPLSTLIDWIDQAILLLHLAPEEAQQSAEVRLLRDHGIRTASDLEGTYRCACERQDGSAQKLLQLLNPGGDVPRLQTILDALRDDEWMENIRVWRGERYPRRVLTDPAALD